MKIRDQRGKKSKVPRIVDPSENPARSHIHDSRKRQYSCSHIHDSAPGFTFGSFGSCCIIFWCSGLNEIHRTQKSVYIVFLRGTMHLSVGSSHACLWIMTPWIIILHSQMNMVSIMEILVEILVEKTTGSRKIK